MKKTLFFIIFAFTNLCISLGQIGVSTTNIYQENFDGMGTAGAATLPDGWKIERMIGEFAQRTVGTYANAVNVTMYSGGANMSATAANGTYNFGSGDATTSLTSTDRALGGSATGATTSTQAVNLYLHIKNTGTTDIANISISYDIEKYRYGSNAAGFSIQLHTSDNGSQWTSAGTDFYTFFPADASTAGTAVVPIQTVSVSKALPVSLAAGAEMYLAWNYSVATGASSPYAQQLALDNVVIIGNAGTTTGINNHKSDNVKFANGILHVSSNSVQSISVHNTNGLKLTSIQNSNTLDLTKLNSGVYVVRILDKNNVAKQIKIIK
jgi:hypothetical protein